MSAIKSTKEMLYDSRSNKSGIIEIEVQGWTYRPSAKGYNVEITDYVIIESEEPTYPDGLGSPAVMKTVSRRNSISHKNLYYSKEQIDTLFQQLGNSVDITESFTNELDGLISQALLIITQTEPIYRVAETGQLSTATDWVLKDE